MDRFGSCTCDEGFYLTDLGCKTCSELIPGCERCYTTYLNTKIPLYTGANVGVNNKQLYLDCGKCNYSSYRVRPNVLKNQAPECVFCGDKWSGCGRCSSWSCKTCQISHVYQKYNSQVCKPCWCWMYGCTWCNGDTTNCIKYHDKSTPFTDFELKCN